MPEESNEQGACTLFIIGRLKNEMRIRVIDLFDSPNKSRRVDKFLRPPVELGRLPYALVDVLQHEAWMKAGEMRNVYKNRQKRSRIRKETY